MFLEAARSLETSAALLEQLLQLSKPSEDYDKLQSFISEQRNLARQLIQQDDQWSRGNAEARKNLKVSVSGGVTRDPEIYVNLPNGTTKMVNSEQERDMILKDYHEKNPSGG